VHYLSLDVEGNELSVLRGIEWARTTIDVITVENALPAVKKTLEQHGMEPALCVSLDTLFVRRPLLRAVQQWHATHSSSAPGGCVTNYTSSCVLSAWVSCKAYMKAYHPRRATPLP
jgi:hypothetical protein